MRAGPNRVGPHGRSTFGGDAVRSRTKLLVTGLVTAAVALGSLLGGVLQTGDGAVRAVAPPRRDVAADQVLAGIASAAGTDTRELERAVRARPTDTQSLVLLGYAYQQRWRETADASNLPRSEVALRRAQGSTRRTHSPSRVSARSL